MGLRSNRSVSLSFLPPPSVGSEVDPYRGVLAPAQGRPRKKEPPQRQKESSGASWTLAFVRLKGRKKRRRRPPTYSISRRAPQGPRGPLCLPGRPKTVPRWETRKASKGAPKERNSRAPRAHSGWVRPNSRPASVGPQAPWVLRRVCVKWPRLGGPTCGRGAPVHPRLRGALSRVVVPGSRSKRAPRALCKWESNRGRNRPCSSRPSFGVRRLDPP